MFLIMIYAEVDAFKWQFHTDAFSADIGKQKTGLIRLRIGHYPTLIHRRGIYNRLTSKSRNNDSIIMRFEGYVLS